MSNGFGGSDKYPGVRPNSEKDRTLHRRNEIKLREFQILIRGEHNNVTGAHQESNKSRDLKVYIVGAELGSVFFRTSGSHQPINKYNLNSVTRIRMLRNTENGTCVEVSTAGQVD